MLAVGLWCLPSSAFSASDDDDDDDADEHHDEHGDYDERDDDVEKMVTHECLQYWNRFLMVIFC